MPETRGTARKARREWSRMGMPRSSMNCLGALPFELTPAVAEAIRVPIPAAGRITNTDMGVEYTAFGDDESGASRWTHWGLQWEYGRRGDACADVWCANACLGYVNAHGLDVRDAGGNGGVIDSLGKKVQIIRGQQMDI